MDTKRSKGFNNDELLLTPVTDQDRPFIRDLFKHEDIRRFYTVSEALRSDYGKLVDYSVQQLSEGRGCMWIILVQKASGSVPCGIVSMEFQGTKSNARISFALDPQYRGQAIMGQALVLLMDQLRNNGVKNVTADVDRDNNDSERLLNKLGFVKNQANALFDPLDMKLRHLWTKDIFDYGQLNYTIIGADKINKLWTRTTVVKVFEEALAPIGEPNTPTYFAPRTGRYSMAFITDVTGLLVGVNADDHIVYNLPWELRREEAHNGKKYLIFSGLGGPGPSIILDGHEIGVEKQHLAELIIDLMDNYPDFYTEDKMSKVIGLEGFTFRNGQIHI